MTKVKNKKGDKLLKFWIRESITEKMCLNKNTKLLRELVLKIWGKSIQA